MVKKLYFGDLEEGFEWSSQGRTVTETDIVQFAGLSGDFNPLHMDQEYAKSTMFGQRIAHGLLGLSMASGIIDDQPPFAVLAFMSVDWKFKAPVFIGDTLRCKNKITKKRLTSSGDRGIVVVDKHMIKQDGQVVQEGKFTLLVENENRA
ncbi:MAG: MaoC/PaaZ C-terminal domain-containing protein [Bdellovibrionota bacterium]